MEKFKELMSKCKCSVSLSVNEHRDFYQSVSEHLKDCFLDDDEISEDVLNRMIETDTIVKIYCYPDTPIGSYRVYHHDIDMAMDLMLEAVNNN